MKAITSYYNAEHEVAVVDVKHGDGTRIGSVAFAGIEISDDQPTGENVYSQRTEDGMYFSALCTSSIKDSEFGLRIDMIVAVAFDHLYKTLG